MPEVDYVVPVRFAPGGIVSADSNYVKGTGWFAGKDFFNMFSFELIRGDKKTVLDDKYATVISDDMAVNLFGSIENCMGKSIRWDLGTFSGTHIVSGVFKKPGKNSSAQVDFLVTHELFLEKNRMDVSWESNPILTYVTLKPGTNLDEFNRNLNNFYQAKRKDENNKPTMFLQRYSDRYLYGHFENGKQAGGRIDYVILFSVIASFIFVIACINFMNLSTARASRRLKEVGIKKTIGVLRRTLAFQYIGESLVMAFLSLLVAVLLIYGLLPQFNLVSGKHLTFQLGWQFLTVALLIVFFTGLLSGSYPAIYLSGFRAAEVLKGKVNKSVGELWIRKGLVVFQFIISILLIVAVCVVYMQMDLMHRRILAIQKTM